MPSSQAPDLRTFEASAAKDHALYDGALVKIFDPYSNWTNSTLGEVPFEVGHFRCHTQKKLAEHLRSLPDEGLSRGIARQDFSDRRLLLQHLAHRFVIFFGRELHTFGKDPQEILMRIRNNLNLLIAHKHLLIEDEGSPLIGHHKVKYVGTDAGHNPAIPMKAEDIALARYIAGPNPHIHGDPATNQHTLDIHAAVQPFLTEIDDTHIVSNLAELRQELRTLLRSATYMSPDLQKKLLAAIMEDWTKTHTTDENIEAISHAADEMDVVAEMGDVLDEEPQVVLEKCFNKLLAAEELDDETKEKLLRWKPIFENFSFAAIDKGDWDFFHQHIVPTLRKYFKKLNKPFGEFGHLGLIFASHGNDVTAEELRDQYFI